MQSQRARLRANGDAGHNYTVESWVGNTAVRLTEQQRYEQK